VADRLFVLRLSGDIYTKARKTRLRFLRRLGKNIEDALAANGIPHRLERTWSRFNLEIPESPSLPEPAETLVPKVVSTVFGLQSVSAVVRRPWARLDDVIAAGLEIFGPAVAGKRFAVRASRRGDRDLIAFDSHAVEDALGRALLAHSAGVDLDAPEVTAFVELEPGQACFFRDKIPCRGGLPVGVEGRAVALVSGGFDSAVAAWLLLKRGVQLDYVFCNLGGSAHRLGALKVMKVLAERWSHGYRPRFHEVDLRPLVAELQEKSPGRNAQVLLKRRMLQVAAAVARHGGAAGIVTGDAIGQVSSQTLSNIAVISQAVRLPVLRPLLGFNKEEILALARQIGVYELAAAVAEYCALETQRPATRANLGEVLAEEARTDEAILAAAIDGRASVDLKSLEAESLAPSWIEIDAVPPGATVLDLRSAAAYLSWHAADALHLEFPRAVAAYRSFDRDQTYVLVCEVGLKSAHLAERMQAAGFRAYNLKGGVRSLMRAAERERRLDPALLAPAVREG